MTDLPGQEEMKRFLAPDAAPSTPFFKLAHWWAYSTPDEILADVTDWHAKATAERTDVNDLTGESHGRSRKR